MGITREHENEVWDSELRLMSDIKTNFDIAIVMIESGEAEQAIMKKILFHKILLLMLLCEC